MWFRRHQIFDSWLVACLGFESGFRVALLCDWQYTIVIGASMLAAVWSSLNDVITVEPFGY